MTGFSVIVVVLIFASIIILSSRFFYSMELQAVTRRLTKSHGFQILKLDYSFEQIVYFVSLPTNIPTIRNAKQEDVVIKLDYRDLLFPRLLGIKIYIKTDMKHIILAYLPIKDFRLPALDQILEQGKIDGQDYLKISTYKLMHKTTLEQISDEVYKQIQVGRNRKMKDVK
ncbi:hypothetical protein EJP82_08855 [Paenibacillus anaericanus]|uniref:Uncharacterized protein n=1 Tax=Paenibacillus anaericanus TaxID=170367 RepID=A0A3S1K9X2_9BACL|nr:hypothetical protein [Paenibacillus anaericanus]RUT47270.1 hypothetical protein EJP82_08855 [Paenibacillus anaericanus]